MFDMCNDVLFDYDEQCESYCYHYNIYWSAVLRSIGTGHNGYYRELVETDITRLKYNICQIV